MHRSHPETDWELMDKQNRKINTDKIRDIRKALLNSKNFSNLSDNYEVIRERDIEGTWVERGSNNLAGIIRTADIDFNNNEASFIIYKHSKTFPDCILTKYIKHKKNKILFKLKLGTKNKKDSDKIEDLFAILKKLAQNNEQISVKDF